MTHYLPPKKEHWTGRATPEEMGDQYWYQAIQLVDLNKHQVPIIKPTGQDLALLGYACDEGVRRNLGRIGAKNAPKSIRERLAKLSYHHSTKRITDFGDVICNDAELETCGVELSGLVSSLISNNVFPILLGGGHDIAYAHFNGIWEAVKNTEKSKIGIINFDAHFDLRPVESEATSGTPFYQILTEHSDQQVDYFAIGIQQASNNKQLFEIAKNKNVSYLLSDECVDGNLKSIEEKLATFIERNDWLYLTIDMDGFSSAYAPGVSAPSPMGFHPFFLLRILRWLFNSQKVISCDIAELNPSLDIDNATSNLAARIVDFIVSVK